MEKSPDEMAKEFIERVVARREKDALSELVGGGTGGEDDATRHGLNWFISQLDELHTSLQGLTIEVTGVGHRGNEQVISTIINGTAWDASSQTNQKVKLQGRHIVGLVNNKILNYQLTLEEEDPTERPIRRYEVPKKFGFHLPGRVTAYHTDPPDLPTPM